MFTKLLKIPLFAIMYVAIICSSSSFANKDIAASISPNINKAFEGQKITFTAHATGYEGTLHYSWSSGGTSSTTKKNTYTMPKISESPYEISCTVSDDEDEDSDSISVTICKVESITPNYGEEVDDGDNNDKTKVYVYQVGHSDVNISVTLSPVLNENELPAGWTIEGGTGAGKLTRTVSSATPSKTEFTFSFNGTDSGYKTTLYVYDAILGLYADKGGNDGYKFGHSWWNLTVDDDMKTFIQQQYEDFNNDDYFGPGGWWPTNAVMFYGPGDVYYGPEAAGDHTATGQKEWHIEYYNLLSALSFIVNLDNDNKDWSLKWDNCTDEAIWNGNSATINTIDAAPAWTSPKALSDWLNSHQN